MSLEILGDFLGILAVSGHADGQRFDSQIEKEGVHRCLDGTEVSHELGCALRNESASEAEFLCICDPVVRVVGSGESGELVGMCHPVKFAAVDDGSADRCIVAIQVLRGRMGNNICAPLDGPAVDRGRKGIVHDERDAVSLCGFGKSLDIENYKGGVGDRLAEHCLSVGTECLLQFLVAAVRIYEGKLDPHLAHGDIEEVESAAVNGGGADNVISAGSNIENAEEIGSLAGRSQHACSSALKSGEFGSDHIVGGILQARVKITRRLQIEQFAHVLTGIVLKSSALNDRDHSRIAVSGRISCLDALCFSFHSSTSANRR